MPTKRVFLSLYAHDDYQPAVVPFYARLTRAVKRRVPVLFVRENTQDRAADLAFLLRRVGRRSSKRE
jgi:hypothetical protein